MTGILTLWSAAVLAILFLSVCVWNNRRTGYSKSSRKAGWKEWNAVLSHNTRLERSGTLDVRVTPNPLVPELPVSSASADDYTGQLIRLSEALRAGDKVQPERRQETGAAENSADRLPRTHKPAGEGRQDPEYSKGNTATRIAKLPGKLLSKAPGNYLIAFVLVLLAALFAERTVLLNGRAPMAFFIAAVIISAGRGIMAGLLATALSLFVMLFLFSGQISVSNATENVLALFLVIGILTNLVFYRNHLKNAALARGKAEIEAVNQQLRHHAKSLAEANHILAEQKAALFQAHEQLRILSKRVANGLQAPLKTISETTGRLVDSSAARLDANFPQMSGELIRDEIRRMDALVAELTNSNC